MAARLTAKRLFAVFTAVVLMMTYLSGAVQAASGDEVRSPKKIISIVYDDSGSMVGDSWVYTSYAMQGLVSLLNEEDELYITYMSNPGVSLELKLDDIEARIGEIRTHLDNSNTPSEALETARKRLDSIQEPDPSTQFWYFVLTDGAIEGIDDLQNYMTRHVGVRMSNGSSLNVIYVSMGTEAVSIREDKSKGLFARHAETDAEIRSALADVANLISGRISADQVSSAGANAVTFSSTLPLYSISVLLQDSDATVVSASTAEGSLHIVRNIGLYADEPHGYSDARLYGNAAVINREENGSAAVISPGTYTVTFSGPVNIKDLLIQYEPAIGVKLEMKRDGIVIDDPGVIGPDDRIDIRLIPVVPGTDDVIPASDLPKGISWRIEYEADGKAADEGNGDSLTGVTVLPGDNIVRGIMQIPGFAPVNYERFFRPVEIVWDLGIRADQPDPLVYPRGNPDPGNNGRGAVRFTITNEGAPLDRETLKKYGIRLTLDDISCDGSGVDGWANRFGKHLVPCSVEMNGDGTFSLIPHKALWPAFLIMAGEYRVRVSVSTDSGVQAEGTFSLAPELSDWIDILKVACVLLFVLYLVGILLRKKFPSCTLYYDQYQGDAFGEGAVQLYGESDSIELSPTKGGLLNPFRRACRVQFAGMELIAGGSGTVLVSGKSLERCRYTVSALNPGHDYGLIMMNLRDGERGMADQQIPERSALYFTEGDNLLSQLHFDG